MADFRERLAAFDERMRAFIDEHDSHSGLSLSTSEDVISYVEHHKINSIRVWFVDILGFLKSFSITPAELAGAFEEGMGFDGSSIQGYQRINESDMVAVPIASTAQLIPFPIGGKKAIRMFADIRNPDGSPFAGDPRQVLRRNLAALSDYDLDLMNIGPEAEFYYFREAGGTELLDTAGYFDLNPVDAGDDLREVTITALQAMGIQVEYSHHEVGPSQHEIDLKYADAATMADRLMTYKWLVKEIAQRNGVHATFMPKPLPRENGSGMHVHLSLFKGGTNAFYDASDEHHLSELAKHFIAGVLHHAGEMCLVTNSWFNSYKRLVPGYEAPVYIAWAMRNRSALIRIPMYKPGKEIATRIELRFPDPACNPYLAFAAMLSAGLDGVKNKMACPDPRAEDIYHLSAVERLRLDIRALPHDLFSAIEKAKDSDYLAGALGEGVRDSLVETKVIDNERHLHHISQLEIKHYTVL